MIASPHLWADTAPTPSARAPVAVAGLPRVLDGKYRLDDRLGEGAVGTVYRATHLGLKKAFALKLLKPGLALDPFSVARFQREAEVLGQLRHPHIVAVTDSGVDPETGAPYLVMELLDGFPLARLMEEEGPLPLERALPILDAIAAAVDAAHAQGILHRDLKPSNVLLGENAGNNWEVKVLDFGLAELSAPLAAGTAESRPSPGHEAERMAATRLTATGDLLGTPLYVAPEVIRRARTGRASDVYSFGVIAYEMLAGRPPFKGSTAEVLAGHLGREPARPAELPAEAWKVLRECLAKDPTARPATAGEVVRRLRAATARAHLARWRRAEAPRRAFLAAGLAAAVPVAGMLLPPAGLPPVERWAHDLRMRAAPARSPDPRILLVTLDEASLAGSSQPLAGRADEIGDTLARILAAGARGVAVDLLLPEQWSASGAFADLVLRHRDALVLAAFSAPDGSVVGTRCLAGLTAAALGPEGATSLFGLVNLDEDPDGVIRRGRLGFPDRAGRLQPSWAARAAGMIAAPGAASAEQEFCLDPRIDRSGFDRISWRDIPGALAREPTLFRDRLVLVGGDVVAAGDDLYRIPRRRDQAAAVSGLVLQALLVDTIVAGLPVRDAPRAPFLTGAALWTALAAATALFVRRPPPVLGPLLLILVLYLGLTVPVFLWTGLLAPVTVLLLPAVGALALALLLRLLLPAFPSPSLGT
jgi:serine/threonine-protein kinase